MVVINSTSFGSITIDDKTYQEADNYIIFWDGEIVKLHTTQRHLFGRQELKKILKKKPEIIIIGTGTSGLLRVSDEVKILCKKEGIKLVEMLSREAVVNFNQNLNKKVVAFIHVTC